MRFAREAWPFVLPFVILATVLLWFGHNLWAVLAMVLAVLLLLFFRDPVRSFGGSAEAVLAPADGRVLKVDTITEPEMEGGSYQRIVTFLSVFNVHTQTVPVSSEVVSSRLTAGAKQAAFRGDIDSVNERHLTVLRTAGGELFGVRQMVGLVARRIVCYLKPGMKVDRGAPLGLIKFGSRVDLLLPEGYRIQVSPGDTVRSGLTVMALPPDHAAGDER
jgi:phosphatidylserine decarboxylase